MLMDSMEDKNNFLLALSTAKINGTFETVQSHMQLVSSLIEKIQQAEIKNSKKEEKSSTNGSKRKKSHRNR